MDSFYIRMVKTNDYRRKHYINVIQTVKEHRQNMERVTPNRKAWTRKTNEHQPNSPHSVTTEGQEGGLIKILWHEILTSLFGQTISEEAEKRPQPDVEKGVLCMPGHGNTSLMILGSVYLT
jgi:hypothetical protein